MPYIWFILYYYCVLLTHRRNNELMIATINANYDDTYLFHSYTNLVLEYLVYAGNLQVQKRKTLRGLKTSSRLSHVVAV